jgi:hypothetical protein
MDQHSPDGPGQGKTDPSARDDKPSAQEGRPTGSPGISLVPEPMGEAEVQAQLDDIDVDTPLVGIVMGSKSDMETMEKAAKELEERGHHARGPCDVRAP